MPERPSPTLEPGEIRRTILQAEPVANAPGYESRLVLLEYGPGAKSGLHAHPVTGLGYVLTGTVRSQFGSGPVETFSTGDSFVDLAEQPHTLSENVSATEPLRMLVSYVLKAGEPNVYPLQQASAADTQPHLDGR